MDFEEFAATVKERIVDFLPEGYEGAQVEVTETRKLNSTYTALIVRRDDNPVAASVNLEEAYREYENGRDMGSILYQLSEAATKQPEGLELASFTDYEKVKNRLFIRVSDPEANRDVLADVPCRVENGLAVTYHIMVALGEDGIGSTLVNNMLMKEYGISEEQLHEDAVKNSPKLFPPTIKPMETVVSELLGLDMGLAMGVPEDFESQLAGIDLDRDGMAVLSNTRGLNGAAVINYPGVLEKLGDAAGVDFFLLPSSTHEMILVADNGIVKLKDLEAMVKEVNGSEVEPKDRLSDEVLHYDVKEHRLEKASDFEKRKESPKKSEDVPKEKHKKERDRDAR